MGAVCEACALDDHVPNFVTISSTSMYNVRRANQFSSLTSKLRLSNKLKCRVRPLSAGGQDDTTRSTSSGNRLQFPLLPREWETKYVPGQMYKYQNALPKLPVPPLKQTLDKFISSVEVRQSCNHCIIYRRVCVMLQLYYSCNITHTRRYSYCIGYVR